MATPDMDSLERAAEIVRSCLDKDGGDLYIGHLGDHRAIELIKKIAAALDSPALASADRS